ncbi:MAG TPA: dephospho-CoA kinase [Polyangia bacterium]|nr:dephospho-CoA kinase [Polyangia bacterium]
MRVVGLTGGIATGKSTAARVLSELGARVIDADAIAREIVAPGQPALAEIVQTFGREMLLPDGTLDRKRMGAVVFADADKRRALNAITHPRIAMETQARLARLRDEGTPVAVYEAALLVENGVHRGLEGLIVTTCDEATQLRRLIERDGFGEAEARARIAAQASPAEKLAAATWVVDTSGPLADTKERISRIWGEILGLVDMRRRT